MGFLFPNDLPGSVVLLRKRTRKEPGLEWMDGLLNGIGGKVERGESGKQAMARECEEEAGIQVSTWEQVAVVTDGTFQLEVFRAHVPEALMVPSRNDVGEPFMIGKCTDVLAQRVPVVPNLQWLLPMAMGADRTHWPFMIIQSLPEVTDF